MNQSVGANMQGFSGKQWNKHIEYTFGKDKETGKIGIQKYSFDTEIIHKPIQEFLNINGYSRAKQNLFQVQKTSLNGLYKNLVMFLGCFFTFLGVTLSIVSFIWFLDTLDLIVLVCSIPSLVGLIVGILLVFTTTTKNK